MAGKADARLVRPTCEMEGATSNASPPRLHFGRERGDLPSLPDGTTCTSTRDGHQEGEETPNRGAPEEDDEVASGRFVSPDDHAERH